MSNKWKIGLGVFVVLLVIGAIGNATKKKPTPAPTAAAATSTTIHTAAPTAAAATSARLAATSSSAAKPAATTPKATVAAAAVTSGGCALQTTRDVLVRTVAPGTDPSAQTLGDVDVVNCRSVFDLLKATSPIGAGYCTTAAYASDNPGYNADAVPAAPLKKLQLSIGAGCS